MLPTAYEFHWDVGHVFFLGIFYSVVATVGFLFVVAVLRAVADLRRRRSVAIDWREACADLPDARRACRHALTGERPGAVCGRSFACGTCPEHAALASSRASAGALPTPGTRLYHRGHTWVEPQPDGTVRIGVEDLARRCFGRPDRLALPAPGRTLHEAERAARVERGGLSVHLCNPVAGEVVEQGDYEGGYLYRLRPLAAAPDSAALLDERETAVWRMRELEALQRWLAPVGTATALADGGRPMADLVAACPDADWDTIWGVLCLEV